MSKKERSTPIVQIIVAIIGTLGVIIAAYIGYLEVRTPPPPSPPTEVKITSHSDRDKVPREVDVRGKYANVPEGMDIWLYVYAPGIRRYFLDPVITFSDGTWEARGVIVGSTDSSDVGAAFKIGVLLASHKASEQIWNKPDDIEFLPSGTERMDEIVVYRE